MVKLRSFGRLFWLMLVAGLIIGCGLTLAAQKIFIKTDIQKSKDAIMQQYLANSIDINASSASGCYKDDTIPSNTKYSASEIKKMLRVNSLNNRAIIVGCGDAEELLAKKPDGKWVDTQVNLTYGSRVNPTWQKACLIQDITTADTVVRPENSSIDAFNLQECQTLDKVYDLRTDPNNPNYPFKLVPL